MTKKKETRIWLNKRDYSLKLYNFKYIPSAKLQNLSFSKIFGFNIILNIPL